jgi:hypothetical protein
MNNFLGFDRDFTPSTPNFEVSEGVRPAQHYAVADYLPLKRFDKRNLEYKVISKGKVLSVDSNNFIVPAGLAIDIETAIGLGNDAWKAANLAAYKNVYSSVDVAEGVKNFAGQPVTAGEPVIKSFFSGATDSALGTQINFVLSPVGLAQYDAFRQNGAGYGPGYSAGSLSDTRYQNFSLQQGIAILTRYFIELPVVNDSSSVLFPGLAVYVGTPKVGNLVTFDADSNFITVPTLSPVNTATAEDINNVINYFSKLHGRVLGKILFVDDKWPKDYLEYVKTWNPKTTTSSGINVPPGNATQGLPDMLTFAGVTNPANAKLVRINVII